jgi:hypothetical protein
MAYEAIKETTTDKGYAECLFLWLCKPQIIEEAAGTLRRSET